MARRLLTEESRPVEIERPSPELHCKRCTQKGLLFFKAMALNMATIIIRRGPKVDDSCKGPTMLLISKHDSGPKNRYIHDNIASPLKRLQEDDDDVDADEE